MPLAERHEVEIGVVGLCLSMLNEYAIGQVEIFFGPFDVVGEDEETRFGMAFAHGNSGRKVIVNRTNAEITLVGWQQIVATAHMNANGKGCCLYLIGIVDLLERAESQYLGGVGYVLFVLRIVVDEHGSWVFFAIKPLEKM